MSTVLERLDVLAADYANASVNFCDSARQWNW
jgi:hypothetical protein